MPLRANPFVLLLLLPVLACTNSNPQLMSFASTEEGPNEFLVAPSKPLETPPSPGALPLPTPGGGNLADPQPLEEAVVALGGSASAMRRGGIPASDSGLLNHSQRLGRDPAIRNTLAQEDLAYRQKNNGRLLERLFNNNVYYDAYDPYHLDQQSEMDRFRRSGIPTPSAPPAILKPR